MTMVLDSKIIKVKQHFGITSESDWEKVRPEWILKLDGIGPATLEHVRIYLAARNLTLLDDGTPEMWKQKIGEAKIGAIMGETDIAETCPFTVIIDAQEKHPFTFEDITGANGVPMIVPTQWKSLGAAHGDYSIVGHEGHVHIERKSLEDAHSTILGWGERRERFKTELENLAAIDVAAVILETSLDELVATAPQWGKRSAQENSKTLFRQVLAWQQDYRVPWIFAGSRQLAEHATFRVLERYWRKRKEADKAAERRSAELPDNVRELIASL
jgi:hypothetical protein